MRKAADPQALKEFISGVPHKANSISYILNCPMCSKKQKLYIRKKDGRFVCFSCKDKNDFYGWAEFALKELLHLPIEELRAALYGSQYAGNGGKLDLKLSDFYGDEDEIPDDEEEMLPTILPVDAFPMAANASRKGQEYLLGRGIGPELWDAYNLLYWPSKQRVIFPVSEEETVWGYQARTIVKDVQPKILTSKGLKRDRVLMFADRVNSEHAVICEGPVDAIKCHLVGGNVATMGKIVTERQIDCLRRKGVRKIYLGLDPDAAEEASKLIRNLRMEFEVYEMEVPHGFKDFGEMPLEAVRDCFLAAKRANVSQLRFFLSAPKF
jgi:DNA primase